MSVDCHRANKESQRADERPVHATHEHWSLIMPGPPMLTRLHDGNNSASRLTAAFVALVQLLEPQLAAQ